MNDIVFQSARKLACLVRDRKISAAEVLGAHIVQIERLNAWVGR